MNETTGATRIGSIIAQIREWWTVHVAGGVDQIEVTSRRREEGKLSEHYLFMTAMSGVECCCACASSSSATSLHSRAQPSQLMPQQQIASPELIGSGLWFRQFFACHQLHCALQSSPLLFAMYPCTRVPGMTQQQQKTQRHGIP